MATKPIFDDVPEWPVAQSAPAPRDHNRPPPEEIIPAEFREALLADQPDFLTLLDRYLGAGSRDAEGYHPGAVDRAKCESDDDLANCGKVDKALRAAEEHVNATHKAVKEPYLTAGRLVDAEKNALLARITAGRFIVGDLMNGYAAEKRRKEREEQQRLEAERRRLEELARENNIAPEAIAPPPPPPAKAEPLRSDGVTVSTTTEWLCQVEDYAKAFRKVKDDAKVREAIDGAIKRIVKATKGAAIPGVRIWEGVKTQAR
jgi:hypothetical protein